MPSVVLICSSTTSAVQQVVTAKPQAGEEAGQRAGQRDAREELRAREPDAAGELDVADVDAAQAPHAC